MPQPGFSSLKLSRPLLEVTRELGYETLTEIQARTIPLLLEGRDLIGQSRTGSGKTAAFSIPILERLELPRRALQALVLCPTRELCAQVAREIRKLGRRHPGLQVLVLSGGQPMGPQLGALEKGAHVAVGTPGRILDHLRRRSLDLRGTRTLVLDEADRMLDMGFEEDMQAILEAAPRTRQTVFFSATFPGTIERMSRAYQRNPARVTVEDAESEAPRIRQRFYETASESKPEALVWLLQQHRPASAIVFCNQKATVEEVTRALRRAGASAAALHGDMEQSGRDREMAKFRNGSTRVLVATDVAARGLDVDRLDLVVNFDLPQKPTTYLHRIGRTGRAGRKGVAVSLGTARERAKLEAIEKAAKDPIERKTMASDSQLRAEAAKGCLEEAEMETFYLSAGRKEKLRPGDILGALTGEAGGLKAADVGKIEIHDHFSYVAVSKAIARTALERLRKGTIKGRRLRIERVS